MVKDTTITSISDYLEWVRNSHLVEYTEHEFAYYQGHVYYRGHASTSWELTPSLFRESGIIHDENKMLQQANNLLWSELYDCKTELEKMIRLQHYGLHTRLLDVTFNPLVALFFACQSVTNSVDDKDGVIYCGHQEESDKRNSQAIAEYAFHYDTYNINERGLNEICEQYKVHTNSLEEAHFLNPPFNNQRIEAQNGAFIMAPLIKKDAIPPFLHANQQYIKKSIEEAFTYKAIIPTRIKDEILTELDYLGFNQATIFIDITNKLQYINKKEAKGWPLLDI